MTLNTGVIMIGRNVLAKTNEKKLPWKKGVIIGKRGSKYIIEVSDGKTYEVLDRDIVFDKD